MNIRFLFLLALGAFMVCNLKAQYVKFQDASVIQPYHLDITQHKTSVLIFPSAIQSADRGDAYVLAERINGAENVLKVKAAKPGFEPSNLQIVTVDGKVYTFNVNYKAAPSIFTVDLRKQAPNAPVEFEGVSLNSKEVEFYCEAVAVIEPFLRKSRYDKYGIEFYLQGVYIKNDVLFLSYCLKNHSQIKYDEASLRFFLRDKKKSKRTAIQDNEHAPLHVFRSGVPEDGLGQTLVAAFPKFSIAEAKYFTAELMEFNGDRNPVCSLDHGVLLKAKTLR